MPSRGRRRGEKHGRLTSLVFFLMSKLKTSPSDQYHQFLAFFDDPSMKRRELLYLLAVVPTGILVSARECIVGCGSNVVDRFFRVRAIPKPGEKGFFHSPTRILEDSIVGGVTLNHLAWAAELGVPTSLLALQGDDDAGHRIRAAMKDLGISSEHIEVGPEYTTAESYVISQPSDGERSIIMASGSTSQINSGVMDRLFSRFLESDNAPRIVSTEVSQVPLSGVEALLKAGNSAGALTVLDVDVSPAVCVEEARLGSFDDLVKCVKLARVLKPTRDAAVELLQLLLTEKDETFVEEMDTLMLAKALLVASGADMVALTAGNQGCALATSNHCVLAESCFIKEAIDSTGAGDAFLGGLLVGLYERATGDNKQSMIPTSREDLLELACLANAAGATCCENLGGLPTAGARNRVLQLRGGEVAEMYAFKQSLAMDSATISSMVRHCEKSDCKVAENFVNAIHSCRGRVHVTGIGKSGIVGRRLAASLASTGTPSQWTHAAEWAHGDLGNAVVDSSSPTGGDVVIALSHSGKTAEVVAACRELAARGVPIYAITSQSDNSSQSPLEAISDAALIYKFPAEGDLKVIEPLGGAPTCSVIAQEALANALVCELIARRRFSREEFQTNHPGGAIGETLAEQLSG